MASIAYFISSYKEPNGVARLVNRLQTPSDFICIHFDRDLGKRKIEDWTRIVEQKSPDAGAIKIGSEIACTWGSFGIVDSTLTKQ